MPLLHTAIKRGRQDIAAFLVQEAHADPLAKDLNGHTPYKMLASMEELQSPQVKRTNSNLKDWLQKLTQTAKRQNTIRRKSQAKNEADALSVAAAKNSPAYAESLMAQEEDDEKAHTLEETPDGPAHTPQNTMEPQGLPYKGPTASQLILAIDAGLTKHRIGPSGYSIQAEDGSPDEAQPDEMQPDIFEFEVDFKINTRQQGAVVQAEQRAESTPKPSVTPPNIFGVPESSAVSIQSLEEETGAWLDKSVKEYGVIVYVGLAAGAVAFVAAAEAIRQAVVERLKPRREKILGLF
jgi:hypothetical protein